MHPINTFLGVRYSYLLLYVLYDFSSFVPTGGAYFPAAAAYMAHVSATAAAISQKSMDDPRGRSSSGRSSSMHCSSESSDDDSNQIRVYNPSAQLSPYFNGGRTTLLNADDLFNKQLKKAADDFIPEHTVEDAEAPMSTPASPQQSMGSRSLHGASIPSQDSRERRNHDLDHDQNRTIDFSSVYMDDTVNAEDNFTNPAWSKLVNRFNSLFPDEVNDDIPTAVSPSIPSVPVFNRPRKTENDEDKPIMFNRPRMPNEGTGDTSWIKKET